MIDPSYFSSCKTDQAQASLSEGYVDTAQLQQRLARPLLRSVLLALLDFFLVL